LASETGYQPRPRYASKCHLCWDIRAHFVRCGLHVQELGPTFIYEELRAEH